MHSSTYDQPLKPVGDETISGLDTVKTLTPPADAIYAWIQAKGQDVRLRDSGANPDANTGMLLTADSPPVFYSGDLAAVKLIEVAASASVFVSYYKPATAAYGVI